MSVRKRNNIWVMGTGPATMVFAHGFGCDQNMWRYVAPAFETRFRCVLLDLVGSGGSDLSAYDKQKYDSLQGYAHDILVDSQLNLFISTNALPAELISRLSWATLSKLPGD